jgi:MoaA/NifB/PqqE/SkfB family radical SAM enzyme
MTEAEVSRNLLTTRGLRYDVEADWILMSTCNYRCTYCFWDAEDLARKIAPPTSNAALAGFFDGTGLTWLLHLTGGEPFHYPGFVDLCTLLTRNHSISINTNADSNRVRPFVDAVDPGRVDSINCGAHPQQRDLRRGRFERFVANVRLLGDSGFDVFASCVMYPPLFEDFAAIWDRYLAEGVVLIPKALQGTHLGRSFPEGYTDSERALFVEYSQRAQECYRDQIAGRQSRPTIDPFVDRQRFLQGIPDWRGSLCSAGRSFVRIREDGAIWRCGPGSIIGSVVEGWFSRQNEPLPCVDVECPYFCEKYAKPST